MKTVFPHPWKVWARWGAPLATSLAMSLSLAGGAARAADLPAAIRIAAPDQTAGSQPFGGNNPIALAAIRGVLEKEFEKDGVKVEWTFYKGAGPAINEALANRQADFAYLGDLASIIGRAGGLPTRFIFAVRGYPNYLGVPPQSSIASLKDLQGKRLALFRGTADQLALGRALAQAGLSERDLRIVNLDWTAARAALAAGQVDAAWQGSGLLALQQRGQIKIPVSSKTLGNRLATTQSGLLATQDFIDKYPGLTQRIINVLVEQARGASDEANRAAVLATWAERGGRPLALLQAEFEGEDLRFRFSPRIDGFIAASYADSVKTAQSLGLIRAGFDVQAWLDPSFVDKAIATLGLQNEWPAYDAQGQAQSGGAK